MKTSFAVAFALAVSACGPKYEAQDVKTPDQIIDDQDQEQQKAESEGKVGSGVTDAEAASHVSDAEKRKKFDEHQTELELKRAQRSAETCAGVVTEAGPTGTATVHITFGNDGNVTNADIDPPFKDTATGKCILKAMGSVIVPPYVGDPVTKDWKIEIAPPASATPDKKK